MGVSNYEAGFRDFVIKKAEYYREIVLNYKGKTLRSSALILAVSVIMLTSGTVLDGVG